MVSAMLPLLGMLAAAVALAYPVLRGKGAAYSIDYCSVVNKEKVESPIIETCCSCSGHGRHGIPRRPFSDFTRHECLAVQVGKSCS